MKSLSFTDAFFTTRGSIGSGIKITLPPYLRWFRRVSQRVGWTDWCINKAQDLRNSSKNFSLLF
jgi:hypothetical protein